MKVEKKFNSGFSLIEMISVIIITGILMISAMPRFLNLQESARSTVLQGISGAMKSVIDQVRVKAIINGMEPAPSAPDQTEFVIDFGIGSTEVDWGSLCPESRAERADKLGMVDFLIIESGRNLKIETGNRHTVAGFDFSFTSRELERDNIKTDDLPEGCYVIYDSYGGRPSYNLNACPINGCECTVRVVDNQC